MVSFVHPPHIRKGQGQRQASVRTKGVACLVSKPRQASSKASHPCLAITHSCLQHTFTRPHQQAPIPVYNKQSLVSTSKHSFLFTTNTIPIYIKQSLVHTSKHSFLITTNAIPIYIKQSLVSTSKHFFLFTKNTIPIYIKQSLVHTSKHPFLF